MAQHKERWRRNMSIFQGISTPGWAILAKSLRDVQMASISNQRSLAGAISPCGAHFGPICLQVFGHSPPTSKALSVSRLYQLTTTARHRISDMIAAMSIFANIAMTRPIAAPAATLPDSCHDRLLM